MKFNRRQMLKLAGMSLLIPRMSAPAWGQILRPEIILSGYRFEVDGGVKEAGLHLGGINLDQQISLANEIHSICHSPELDLKILLPKLDKVAYLQQGQGPLVKFSPGAGNYFYGHGAIDSKRKLLYTTEARIPEGSEDSDRRDIAGYIYAYSLPDLKPMGKFESFGSDPHDLLISQDRLLVCNGGRSSGVAVINLTTRKLIQNYTLPADEELSLRHITEIDSDNFAVGSLRYFDDQPCPLYHLNLTHGLGLYHMPGALGMSFMKGQLLSVLAHGGYVYATCPMMNSLLVWTSQGEFIGGQVVPRAASLAYSVNERGVIVGSGEESEPGRVARIRNGQLHIEKLPWARRLTGSHSVIL